MFRAGTALVFVCACGTSSTSSLLALDSVTPSSGKNNLAVTLQLSGSFHLPVRANFDNGATTAVTPSATLDGGSLDDVAWRSDQLVTGSVPAGLTPGVYDVSVSLGDETATLPMAYEVLTSLPPAPFALSGADWLLPCIVNSNPNPKACTCANSVVTQAKTIGGMPGQHWHVTVHVQGVMEQMTYTGGTAVDATGWYIGGTYSGGNNYYGFTVSSPAATYYLNNGPAMQSNSWVFDYQQTFDVDAGATITFNSSGQDGIMWEGVDVNDVPISLSGVADPPQPYNGQFARLDVVDVTPF